MQIQKGLVKYKDRNDILCTYGLTDEGKQYYFLDNSSMSNGNIIASTILVEAIDPLVVASSIGVINANGEVIIPFENKSIKPIMDGLLLVETSNSTTPSVVEANNMRSDPLAATKLVTTPAGIKEKINSKMGSDGRFIFNDQFSEATVCDYNGNNLLDNQYFSFIAIKNNENLYLSKNTVDSPVLEYSIANRMFVARDELPLNVEHTDVTQETIDVAMQAEEKAVDFKVDDITEKDFESVNNDDSIEEPISVEPSVVDPNVGSVTFSDDPETLVEEIAEDGIEEPVPVIPDIIEHELQDVNTDDVVLSEQNVITAESVSESIDENELDVESSTDIFDEPAAAESASENDSEEEPVVELDSIKDEISEEVNSDVIGHSLVKDDLQDNVLDVIVEEEVEKSVEENSNDDKLMEFDFTTDNIDVNLDSDNKEEINLSNKDAISGTVDGLFDMDLESDIFADSSVRADRIDIDSSYSDFGYKVGGTKDSIIEDVASTMTNLIRQNRNQKQVILSYEDKMDAATSAYKKIVDKARSQSRDVELLRNKLKNYETIVSKLEAKLDALENKVHDQELIIANQTRELTALRPQVEGKEELVKILADAQSLLEQEI